MFTVTSIFIFIFSIITIISNTKISKIFTQPVFVRNYRVIAKFVESNLISSLSN